MVHETVVMCECGAMLNKTKIVDNYNMGKTTTVDKHECLPDKASKELHLKLILKYNKLWTKFNTYIEAIKLMRGTD